MLQSCYNRGYLLGRQQRLYLDTDIQLIDSLCLNSLSSSHRYVNPQKASKLVQQISVNGGSVIFTIFVTQVTPRWVLGRLSFVKKLYFSSSNHRIVHTRLILFLYICFWSERVSQKYRGSYQKLYFEKYSQGSDNFYYLLESRHNCVCSRIVKNLYWVQITHLFGCNYLIITLSNHCVNTTSNIKFII